MFHSCPSSSSSSSCSSSSPAATNYQQTASSRYFFEGNANVINSVHRPSYFASYSHLRDIKNDSSDFKEMRGPEVSAAEIVAGAKASRYSPEERQERIEKYRSKRNLRNFQKKITYECRKTLADSRPRVRGRFTKNAETESESDTAESTHGSGNGNGNRNGNANADRWWPIEAELMGADKSEADSESYYDDELWAHLVSDFSANI